MKQQRNDSPQGLALALILVGALVVAIGALSSLITGDQRLMFVVSAGFFTQFLGWRRHRRAGGA